MKTVFLLGSYGPSLLGFRRQLILDMVAKGHRVIASAPNIEGPISDQLTELGAEPCLVSMSRTGMNPLADLRYMQGLKAIFRACKPDIFLGYTAKPCIWGVIAARSAGVPAVAAMITGLGYAFTDGNEIKRMTARTTARLLYRRALAKCDRVIFQNPDDRDLFRSQGLVRNKEQTRIINGSGVDLEHFSATPVPNSPSFLMIARLLGDKGVREYCQAAIAIKQKIPDTIVQLAGWLDDSPNSISQEELDQWIASGIEFLGRLDDVRPALTDAAVYVLPSYREGLPVSVMEAMATGRAIITTDAPGCRETVVDGDNGFLIPPRNADAIATAMQTFIDQPELARKMGARSREIAEEKFDVHKVNAEILNIIGLK